MQICKNFSPLHHVSEDTPYSPPLIFSGCTKLLHILFRAEKHVETPHSSYLCSHSLVPKCFHVSLNFCNVNVNSVSVSYSEG